MIGSPRRARERWRPNRAAQPVASRRFSATATASVIARRLDLDQPPLGGMRVPRSVQASRPFLAFE